MFLGRRLLPNPCKYVVAQVSGTLTIVFLPPQINITSIEFVACPKKRATEAPVKEKIPSEEVASGEPNVCVTYG
mgnify:CR=1 FL=1